MMFAEMSALTILSLDIIMAERHTTITRVKVISSMEHFIKKINHRIFPCTCFLPCLFLHQKSYLCLGNYFTIRGSKYCDIIISYTALRDNIFSVLNMKCIVIIICEANSLVIHSIHYCNTWGCLNLDNH